MRRPRERFTSKDSIAMGLRHSRTSFAVAVLLAGGWGQLQLQGQDRFIVQPNRRPVVAPTAATLTVSPPTLSAPPTTEPAVVSPTWSSIAPPTSAVVTTAPPLNDVLEMTAAPQQPKSTRATTGEQTTSENSTGEKSTGEKLTGENSIGDKSTGEKSTGESQLRWMSHSGLATVATPPAPADSTRPESSMPTAGVPTAGMPNAVLAADTPTVGPQTSAAPKQALASLVSSQIMAERPADSDASGRAVAAIDAPPGWQAIGQELSQRIANCEGLLNRKAYYSAREEADAAMLYLVRVLDLMSNRYTSEPAWYAARKAMHEAEDFSTAQRLTSDSDFLRRIILSHETPVLKDVDAAELAPLAAAQHYRQYAENKLIEAAQGHPWAAEIAYALGRTYQAQADVSEDGSEQMLRWRAVTLYRAARGIAPGNALAANQLGFVLLQMDRPLDARSALIDSLKAHPSLAAYENLVEASRRLGDSATGNWAMQQVVAFRGSQPTPTTAPEVIEVDPRTFAALSPYAVVPTAPASPSAPLTPRTAAGPTSPNNH